MRKLKCESCGAATELTAADLAVMAVDGTAETRCSCGLVLQAKYHGDGGTLLVAAVGHSVNLQARHRALIDDGGQELLAIRKNDLEGVPRLELET